MRKRATSLIAVLFVALLASACSVTFTADGSASSDDRRDPDTSRPRPSPSAQLPGDDAFLRFEVGPNTLYPESVMYFRLRVREAGYLTVSAMGPDGRVTMLARDVAVDSGRQVLYPPSGSSTRIRASAPAGIWRVRAEWTPRPTNARYDAARGLDAWTDAIADNLAGISGASVLETSYEVSAP
jgi:hypothetical protein